MTDTADWVAPFAHALDRHDQPDGVGALLAAIRAVAPFHLALSVVYRRDGAPSYVFDTFSGPRARQAVELYIARTYVLNPVFNTYLAGLEPGVHLMRDLAPDGYFTSDLYQNLEIRRHEGEELGYRTGASCYGYACLARGRTDLAVDAGFDTYDLYAPTAIIQGAGGQVSDWAGQPLHLGWQGRVIASGDAGLHHHALERLAG